MGPGGACAEVRIGCRRRAGWPPPTARTAELALRFGLGAPAEEIILADGRVPVGPGRIVAFCGPSGSGKSTALRLIAARYPRAGHVDRMGFPEGRAIVDAVAPGAPLGEALQLLSACGLGEARLWLRGYEELSDGERFRARLARAVAAAPRGDPAAPLIIDEFASGLHRRAARAVAYNLRKLASRRGLAVVLATSHDDVLADLQADTCVTLMAGGIWTAAAHRPAPRPLSLTAGLRIRPGRKSDYAAFAAMHYRGGDELGFVDKVFVLGEGEDGPAVGIVVYAHGPAELALRNAATGGRFKGNLRLLNDEVRMLRRLVIHPDLRGCGLGHGLVAATLPRVGTQYVECLATMGAVNPVFEKAGMRRVGECSAPADCQAAVAALEEIDVDPFAAGFARHVCLRPQVRTIVADAVRRWYRATSGQGEQRVRRQGPMLLARLFRGLIGSRPVYYLWERASGQTGNQASE